MNDIERGLIEIIEFTNFEENDTYTRQFITRTLSEHFPNHVLVLCNECNNTPCTVDIRDLVIDVYEKDVDSINHYNLSREKLKVMKQQEND